MNIKRGFTLVELLVVMMIIIIFAAIVLPRLLGTEQKARDAVRVNAIHQFQVSLETFYNTYRVYPCGDAYNKDTDPSDGISGVDGSASEPFLDGACNLAEGEDCGDPATDSALILCQNKTIGVPNTLGLADVNMITEIYVNDNDPLFKKNRSRRYVYWVDPTGQYYRLFTRFEEAVSEMINDGGMCDDWFEISNTSKTSWFENDILVDGLPCPALEI